MNQINEYVEQEENIKTPKLERMENIQDQANGVNNCSVA